MCFAAAVDDFFFIGRQGLGGFENPPIEGDRARSSLFAEEFGGGSADDPALISGEECRPAGIGKQNASVAIRLAGNRVIEGFRSLAGTTDTTTAAPGTIRGDLGRDWGLKVQQNLVHGSDSPESAARELGIWFA